MQFIGVKATMLVTKVSLARATRQFSAATPALVKALRERTGAPMMECKKALDSAEVNGDIAKAVDWLRAKGIARASSSATSSRKAVDGLIALSRPAQVPELITLAEVNSETDFVARNKEFQEFVGLVVKGAATIPAANADVDAATILKVANEGKLIQDSLGDVVSKIRENIVIRRATNVSATAGTSVFGTYVHGKVVSESVPADIQLGRSAGVVELTVEPPLKGENAAQLSVLTEAARKLAMHVVAAKPSFLQVSQVPAELVAKETAIFREQSEGSGKPAEIVERMVNNKVAKRLGEICLLEQAHVAEEGAPVISKHLTALSKQLPGHQVSIARFCLWSLGQTQA